MYFYVCVYVSMCVFSSMCALCELTCLRPSSLSIVYVIIGIYFWWFYMLYSYYFPFKKITQIDIIHHNNTQIPSAPGLNSGSSVRIRWSQTTLIIGIAWVQSNIGVVKTESRGHLLRRQKGSEQTERDHSLSLDFKWNSGENGPQGVLRHEDP